MYNAAERVPTVSVVIPTHNRSNMLRRAIQSVLDQTFTDFEVIVVDDASSDGTSETVECFCDHRIRYIRHLENKGGSATRNTGIANARGTFIGFLDDDDEWLPTKLELQVERFKERPDVSVVACTFFVRNAEKDRFIDSISISKSGFIYNDLLWNNFITTSTVLIRNDVLNSQSLFDPELPRLQDWDLWLRLLKESALDYVPEPLVVVNVHDSERISTDCRASLIARKRILEKYWADIEPNKALLSYHYLRIGSAYCQLGNMNEGRLFLRKSASLTPLNTRSTVMLVLSCLGYNVFMLGIKVHRWLRYQYRKLEYSASKRHNLVELECYRGKGF